MNKREEGMKLILCDICSGVRREGLWKNIQTLQFKCGSISYMAFLLALVSGLTL